MGLMKRISGHERDTLMQRGILRNIVLLTLLTAGAVAGVFVFGAYKAVADLSGRAIDGASERTIVELEQFFGPVRSNLGIFSEWGRVDELELSDHTALNRRLIPILEQHPQMSSILFANTKGREYLLLRQGDTWVNRLTDREARGDATLWKRWDKDGALVEEWTKELDYDSRLRPWHIGAMSTSPGRLFWTEPYVFFTTKEPGITASTRFRNSEDGDQYVVAIDVLLSDISAFTTQLGSSANGHVTILTDDGRTLGLPRHAQFAHPGAIKSHVLQPVASLEATEINTGLGHWSESGREEAAFTFSANGETWWAGFRRVEFAPTSLVIAVMVPNSDFLGEVRKQAGLVFLITFAALVAAVLIGRWTMLNFRRRMEVVVEAARELGQYTLEEKIGSGGMGDVYRARHAMLRRPTAIKLLKPGQYTSQSLKRFEQEVQLTCKLTHPNTINIYDYGRTPDGVFYYAMEYLDGATLHDFICHHGPCSPGRTIYLLEQICDSLREAHGVGLIHRDIKPANIFVCERGARFDTIKVLDFGLVKEVVSKESPNLTLDGALGSPGFMAPETITGTDQSSSAVDIYAVGAVGYALLVGQGPYEGETPLEVMMKQANEDPVPPSRRLEQRLPKDLEALIMSCMSRSPQERPKTMSDVLDALRRCGDAGTWDSGRAKQWWIEHGQALTLERRPAEAVNSPTAQALTIEVAPRSADTWV